MNSQSILLGEYPHQLVLHNLDWSYVHHLLLGKDVKPYSISPEKLLSFSELVLSDGYIHSDDILLHIAEALQTNLSLTKLSLPNMMLLHTEQNGSALNKVLQVNKSLTHLDLSWNETMSDSRARCIFEGLQHNTTLVNLNLCRNGITASDPDTMLGLLLKCFKWTSHLYILIFQGTNSQKELVSFKRSQSNCSYNKTHLSLRVCQVFTNSILRCSPVKES